jgi:hypothetical protein
MSIPIKPRERAAILGSLRAGVVPRIGLHHLQVGRKEEIAAVLQDLQRIEAGAATIRFIIGRYGAGKSFFLNVSRMVALERKFVVIQADLALDRRLHGSGGQARGLYAELLRNLAVRSKPDGGALASVVQLWVSDVDQETRSAGGTDADVIREIHTRLRPLQELVSGYDFATVVGKYFDGYQAQNDQLMAAALRWLRAEFGTKTEARQELGVRSIIDDQSFYVYLKLLAAFVRMAGYAGLLVNLDEMGVLSHRLNNSQARNSNFEVILQIVNDCLQGNASGIGFLFGGTDAFLEDRRRGLASYEALASRLADNTFVQPGLKDFSGPVIRLTNLSPEDLFVLLRNIRHVFALADLTRYLIPDEGITAFMTHCSRTLGADYFRTPRDAVKGFVGLLSVLEQNPGAQWDAIVAGTAVEQTPDPESQPVADEASETGPGPQPTVPKPASAGDDDLTAFRL